MPTPVSRDEEQVSSSLSSSSLEDETSSMCSPESLSSSSLPFSSVDVPVQSSGDDSLSGVTVLGPDRSDRTGSIREAVEDLGEVDSLDGGFYEAAGGVLDACLPNEGNKGKVQINVNVPVDASGTVKVAFEFIAECERDDKGVKGRVQVGGGVLASKQIDLYFVTQEVFARATVFGYMESYGDSGKQLFDLLGLGIQQRIAGVSQMVADAVFDGDYIQATIQEMDDDDYVESGLGASASVGTRLSTGTGDEEESVGGEVGVTIQSGTRLSGDGRGGLRQEGVTKLDVGLSGSAEPFALGGKLVCKWKEGALEGVEGELSGEAALGGDELNALVVGGQWLSGLISSTGDLIGGGAGLLDDSNAARQVGGLASFVRQSSGLGVATEAATAQAISQLDRWGAKLGFKLTAKGTWESGKGYGLDICLERVQQIEFGDGPRDAVYALVENVQRVFQIKA